MVTSSVTPVASFHSAPAQKPIILLVEDESIVREVTRQVLEHAGYQVLESESPRDALRLAAQHRGQIGVLLSDVLMPEMNGLDLARRMRKMQPLLTTVLMSGYANIPMLQQVASDPLNSYIQKPFTVDLLVASIADALATRAAEEAGTWSAAPCASYPEESCGQ